MLEFSLIFSLIFSVEFTVVGFIPNDELLELRESLYDLKKFIKLTDDYIMIMLELFKIKSNQLILDKFKKHEFYKLVMSYTSKNDCVNFESNNRDNINDDNNELIPIKYKTDDYELLNANSRC